MREHGPAVAEAAFRAAEFGVAAAAVASGAGGGLAAVFLVGNAVLNIRDLRERKARLR